MVKKKSENVGKVLLRPCPNCSGTGKVPLFSRFCGLTLRDREERCFDDCIACGGTGTILIKTSEEESVNVPFIEPKK